MYESIVEITVRNEARHNSPNLEALSGVRSSLDLTEYLSDSLDPVLKALDEILIRGEIELVVAQGNLYIDTIYTAIRTLTDTEAQRLLDHTVYHWTDGIAAEFASIPVNCADCDGVYVAPVFGEHETTISYKEIPICS